jgi:RNA polymerase sigma factor (sigma-70 family)
MLSEGIFPDRQNAFASDITAREGGTGLGLAFLWYVLKGQDMEIKVDSGSSLKKGGARFIIVYSKTETVIRYKQEKLSMTDSDWIKVGLILEGKTECKEGEENRYLRYKNCHDPLRQLVAMRKARGLKRGLTLPEETLLIAEYRKGNGAAYEILRRWHLPLIYREAHRFIGCYNLPEEKFDDLVSEGAIGFFKALKKYDPSRGVHIRTYAAYWVSQSMSRGIQKEHLGDIRLPIGVRTKLNKLYRAEMRFYNEFDRSPEPEDYDTIRIFAEEEGVSEELFRKLVRIRSERCDISIDDPISEDSRRRFRDSIPDIRVRMADDEVEIAENIELDRNIFERLRNIFIEKGKEKQFRIYCMYKGYDPDTGEKIDEDLSLDDVGAEYGLTRERVRQIVAKVEKRRKQIVLMVLSKKQPEDEEIAPPKAKAKKRPSKRVRRSV